MLDICFLSLYFRGYGDLADVRVVIDIIVMHPQRSTGRKYIVDGFFRDRPVRKSRCLFGSYDFPRVPHLGLKLGVDAGRCRKLLSGLLY